MRALAGAVRILTVIPVPGGGVAPGRAALFFPLVGAMLGAAGAVLLLAARQAWPEPLPSLLVVFFWVAVTGALHEDGLADAADAFRAHRAPEKIMAILKDSRVGTFGALAVVFSILLRWQALAAMRDDLVPALAAALAVSRTAAVLLAAVAPPVGEGLGALFRASLTRPVVAGATAQAVAALAWAAIAGLGWPVALGLAAAPALCVAAARTYFMKRIGGVNGDCLGAVTQVTEILSLLILAWRNST